jgi:hypothetical protein
MSSSKLYDRHKAYLLARYTEDPKTGCWNWTQGLTKTGYAVMGLRHAGTCFPHRLAYKLFIGDWVPGLMICHTCDNRKCINPAHLTQETAAWNMLDKTAKGRGNLGKHVNVGEAHGCAKLSNELVIQIRQSSKTQTAWAKELGISQGAISRAINKHTWRAV